MHIAFVRVRNWEKPIIRRKLRGNKITFLDEELTNKNVSKIKDVTILSVFIKTKVTKDILRKMPKLKLIVTRSTGFDHIDISEAKNRKISVANIPTYGENTVAEHTFALILALSRNVHKSYLRTLQSNYSIEGLKGFDLKGKTLGVIGAGNIGKHVIRIARGFDMKVLVSDPHPDLFLSEEMGFSYVSLQTLLKESDIVSLHAPYSKKNHHLIDRKAMKKMKKGSILINTSRGGLVDTKALIEALETNHLGGAGLDVIEGEQLITEEKQLLHEEDKMKALEQLVEDHVLIALDRVVFTPHIGFYSQEALERIIHDTIEIVKTFVEESNVEDIKKVC